MEETPQLRVPGMCICTCTKEAKTIASLLTKLQFTIKLKITMYSNFKTISTSHVPINYKLPFKCQHVNTAINRTIFYNQGKKLLQAFNFVSLYHMFLKHSKSQYSETPFKTYTREVQTLSASQVSRTTSLTFQVANNVLTQLLYPAL